VREVTDLEISAGIRRELSGRRVDLVKLKFVVSGGVVTFTGDLAFIGLTKTTDEIAVEIKFIESTLRMLRGVKELIFTLDNWARSDSGKWDPKFGTAGSAGGDGFHCPDCHAVFKFCPCCGKPLAAGTPATSSAHRPSFGAPSLLKPLPRKLEPLRTPQLKPLPTPPQTPVEPLRPAAPLSPNAQGDEKKETAKPPVPPVQLKPFGPSATPATPRPISPLSAPGGTKPGQAKPVSLPGGILPKLTASKAPPAPFKPLAPSSDASAPEARPLKPAVPLTSHSGKSEPAADGETAPAFADLLSNLKADKPAPAESEPLFPIKPPEPPQPMPEEPRISEMPDVKTESASLAPVAASLKAQPAKPPAENDDFFDISKLPPIKPRQPGAATRPGIPKPSGAPKLSTAHPAESIDDTLLPPVKPKQEPHPEIPTTNKPAMTGSLEESEGFDDSLLPPMKPKLPESAPARALKKPFAAPVLVPPADDDTPLPPMKHTTAPEDDDTPLPPMKQVTGGPVAKPDKPQKDGGDPFASLFSEIEAGKPAGKGSGGAHKPAGDQKDGLDDLATLDLDMMDIFQKPGAKPATPSKSAAPKIPQPDETPNLGGFLDLDAPIEPPAKGKPGAKPSDKPGDKGKKDPFAMDDFDISKFKI